MINEKYNWFKSRAYKIRKKIISDLNTVKVNGNF